MAAVTTVAMGRLRNLDRKNDLNTKDELINSLERTFKPKYTPILSGFRFALGKGFDFEKEFGNLIQTITGGKIHN